MVSARDIMHADIQTVGPNDTLTVAAARMRDLHVGSMPVLDDDGNLLAIVTDRDIVVRCVAEGFDPQATTTQMISTRAPIAVDASADVSDVLTTMEQNEIRRVPVIDHGILVGMISEANLATQLGPSQVAAFATAVYSAPPNN